MKKIILISFITICSLIVNGQGNKDSTISKWSYGLSFAPNITIHILQNKLNGYNTYFYPYSNEMKMGYGFDLYTKRKISKNINFVTGLSFDALTYEFNYWNTFFQKNYFTYYSFGIPLLLELTSSQSKKLSFNFKVGLQIGFIANVKDFDATVNNYQYPFAIATFNVTEGGFSPFGIIGFGFQYKFNEKISLFLEPQFFQGLQPLTYEFNNSGNWDDVKHYIQFIKVFSINYKF
jgi:hypothetical protein